MRESRMGSKTGLKAMYPVFEQGQESRKRGHIEQGEIVQSIIQQDQYNPWEDGTYGSPYGKVGNGVEERVRA